MQQLAAGVAADRRPATADSPFLTLQGQILGAITAALGTPIAWCVTNWPSGCSSAFMALHRRRHSSASTRTARYGHFPAVRPRSWPHERPQAARVCGEAVDRRIYEALTRAVLYVIAAERMIDQRSALALNVARQRLMHLSLAEFKALVREQAFLLQLERERAVETLASLVPDASARKELLKQVNAIVGASDIPLAAERDRLAAAIAGASGTDWEDGSSCNVRAALRRYYCAALSGPALIGMNFFTRTC